MLRICFGLSGEIPSSRQASRALEYILFVLARFDSLQLTAYLNEQAAMNMGNLQVPAISAVATATSYPCAYQLTASIYFCSYHH
jgi:hypothetical protein